MVPGLCPTIDFYLHLHTVLFLKIHLFANKHISVMTSNVLKMGAELTLETLCIRNIPCKINNVHHSINYCQNWLQFQIGLCQQPFIIAKIRIVYFNRQKCRWTFRGECSAEQSTAQFFFTFVWPCIVQISV